MKALDSRKFGKRVFCSKFNQQVFSFKRFFFDWIEVTEDSTKMKTLIFIFSIYATVRGSPDDSVHIIDDPTRPRNSQRSHGGKLRITWFVTNWWSLLSKRFAKTLVIIRCWCRSFSSNPREISSARWSRIPLAPSPRTRPYTLDCPKGDIRRVSVAAGHCKDRNPENSPVLSSLFQTESRPAVDRK